MLRVISGGHMTTSPLKTGPIDLEIEPVSFEAYLLNGFGQRVSKRSLKVNREGFSLVTKKGRTVSTVVWQELGEFKNEVREKGRFSYFGTVNNGFNDVRARIRVGLANDPGERERLTAIFDKLPQGVFGRRCPSCGGPVVENICENCGRTFTGQNRRKGLNLVLIGGVALIAGIVLTNSSYNSASGSIKVYIGLICAGVVIIIIGLFGLLSGKRL
jgi:hypothetical protein